jgi:hypothetical protein
VTRSGLLVRPFGLSVSTHRKLIARIPRRAVSGAGEYALHQPTTRPSPAQIKTIVTQPYAARAFLSGLSGTQVQFVHAAAAGLPVEARGSFLESVVARLHHDLSEAQLVGVVRAVVDRHRPAA